MTIALATETVTLTWQSYDRTNQLIAHAVPVPPDGAVEMAARFGEIPGIRNPRINGANTVQLGDVSAPRYGWDETERHKVPMFPIGYAAQAVRCPKCRQPGGMGCTSTGGGNAAPVSTHKARTDRIGGWTNAVQEHAATLVRAVGYHGYARESLFAVFEQAAKPIPGKAMKQYTPKGVRLSEKQAEEIEYMVMAGGVGGCSTAHFHGDHQERQTVIALEGKGIVEWTGYSDGGYTRNARLTAFGWQVYRQHRLIIRRLDDAEVDRLESAASREQMPEDAR
jgi:hypothetical protein